LKKQTYIVEMKNNHVIYSQSFILNYQQAILLSLLNKRKITKEQFEKCMEKINRDYSIDTLDRTNDIPYNKYG
jgi:hypothetical protein